MSKVKDYYLDEFNSMDSHYCEEALDDVYRSIDNDINDLKAQREAAYEQIMALQAYLSDNDLVNDYENWKLKNQI